ncbi:L-threonine ammonia-lyase-like isoform X1 [Tigriopus californicus]|uniref:L-threonine ammonia-lyase-like isoform X1 n=1 Tax=Tigriopus californicus TaxID=6832 RepID=UPI0027DA38CE|nr:L-threonine ammonia-lyase-like isoform X1 [Tigriopus californicus]
MEEETLDPWCNPEEPRVVQFEQISAAAYRVREGIVRTPCDRSHLSEESGMEIFLKKDYMQYTGSFKERGARYSLIQLDPKQKKKGVISASAGNHAQDMAYHGGQLGIPVTVVMPVIAPIMKIENCKKYGANVVIQGQNMGESKAYALKLGKERGLLYINGFDHPNILVGQGTMGLEILEQVPDVDAVVIPVGGGGLLAGCAVALKTMKPDIKIIGVEPELCPSFTNAMKAGHPVKTPTEPSLADGLTVPTVGVNALATAAPYMDRMVTVSEEWIAISILRLVEMEKAVVEGGGAAGVAAILAGLLPDLRGKKVVVPLCGGNIDTTILGRCLERGLAADGRLVKFTVTVSDRPGGIAELAKTLCNCGVSIKDMVHERAWIKNDIFSVEVKVLAETRNHRHTSQMVRILREKYDMRVKGKHDEELDDDFGDDEAVGLTNGYMVSNSLSEPDNNTFAGHVVEDDSESDTESEDDEAHMSENVLSDLDVDKTQDSGWDESQGSDIKSRKFNAPLPKPTLTPIITIEPPTEKRISRGSRKSKH